MDRFHHIFLLVAVIAPLAAETPPCGVEVVRSEGPSVDERFVAANPDSVKAALLKALPAVAAKVEKDEGFHIKADTDRRILLSEREKNKDSGVRGLSAGLAFGPLVIDIREATQGEIKGSMLRVEYQKPFMGRPTNKGNNAQPLAEETVCLVKLLSTNDPTTNPRGLESSYAGPPRAVTLPEGAPLKVLLRDPLYSKGLEKNSTGQTVQFEVAEDVLVDGVAVVRRGALATGHFTNIEKAKGYGRHAEVEFVFDAATAVDGQSISITGAGERARGARSNETVSTAVLLPTLGWLAKGADVLIRAGTSYDLEVSGSHAVQVGR